VNIFYIKILFGKIDLKFDRKIKIEFSVGYARITHGGLTDTEIQMAKFKFPTDEKFDDHPIVVTDPSVVTNQSLLFNSKSEFLDKIYFSLFSIYFKKIRIIL
jgi:hypothetical protein